MIHNMDGSHFAGALRSGTLAVVGQESLLNRINVFPVPDGDTGYNLVATLRAAAGPLGEGAPRAVGEAVQAAADSAELFRKTLPPAREALARTPEQLEVLARAGVVDAGAKGFVTFLEGASRFLEDGVQPEWLPGPAQEAPVVPDAAAHAEFTSGYRYCTEALLEAKGLSRAAVADAVGNLGDSLVVAGGGNRLRLHIHTNAPRRFFEIAGTHGFLKQCKVDDMWLQHPPQQHHDIALVTDSTCDLPEQHASAIEAYSLPLNISFGDETFRDGTDLAPAAFYQRMRRADSLPRTSQPSAGDFANIYKKLLDRHESVISVHIASAISGTVESARTAAARVAPERIHVVDSRQVSVGLGFVVDSIGRAIRQGASVEDLLGIASRVPGNVRVFGTTPTLEHAVRGGRVNARVAWVLERLGIRPIIDFDEKGKPFKGGVKTGFGRALSVLAKRARRFSDGAPSRVMVVHADALAAGERLAEKVREILDQTEVPIVQAGAVLGTHVGPGAVALAVRRETG